MQTMNNAAEASVASLCEVPSNPVPSGAHVGYFTTTDNVRIRYATFPRTGPVHKGTVCIVQDRTEFIEKYFETIADFQKRGFAVATFDLRGQGGSERLIANKKLGFVEHFDDYWTDLSSFHAQVLLPDCPPPFYLVGHSTGGLVALLAAARDRLMFDRAFLTSPMVMLPGLPLGPGGATRLVRFLRFMGLSRVPLGRKADKPQSEASFEGNPLTGDKTRYMRAVDVLRASPELEVQSPTLGWIGSSLEAMLRVNSDEFPGRLKIPVFICAAALDRVVDTSATEMLGLRMRNGHLAIIPGARHEMLMETDAVREQVLAAFDAFVTDQAD